MCGIVAVIDSNRTIDEERLYQMADTIRYRGPDDQGIYIDGNIGLAHNRLSILDLSEKGHQSMASKDEKLWIIYNGEVYNFKEIRSELQSKGYSFISNTDTEVVLKAYEE